MTVEWCASLSECYQRPSTPCSVSAYVPLTHDCWSMCVAILWLAYCQASQVYDFPSLSPTVVRRLRLFKANACIWTTSVAGSFVNAFYQVMIFDMQFFFWFLYEYLGKYATSFTVNFPESFIKPWF